MAVDLKSIAKTTINSALRLLPAKMSKPEQLERIQVALLTIGLQESRFEHRWQIIDLKDPSRKGPARGFWQFERAGGVRGVLNHTASKDAARALCKACGVEPEENAVWLALESNDVLAAGFARLLLWTDPRALPHLGQPQAMWDYYIANWRPGSPHPETWGTFYQRAVAAVQG